MASSNAASLAAASLVLMCFAANGVATDTAPADGVESQLTRITQQLRDGEDVRWVRQR